MDSRYPRIDAAAVALLLQVALTVATAPAALKGTTTNTTTTAASHTGLKCNRTCGGQTPNIRIPYPLGFSPGCSVQLSCTPDGTVFIEDFPVQSIAPDSIYVTMLAMCERPFRTIDPLFGHNLAPTSKNRVVLDNCTRPSQCRLPSPIMTIQFQLFCNTSSRMMRCYSGKENENKLLCYYQLFEKNCRILVSSISEPELVTNQSIQLGWWVNGDDCRCSNHANCTQVSSVPGGGNGYRCLCNAGFHGDVFLDGNVLKMVLIIKQY